MKYLLLAALITFAAGQTGEFCTTPCSTSFACSGNCASSHGRCQCTQNGDCDNGQTCEGGFCETPCAAASCDPNGFTVDFFAVTQDGYSDSGCSGLRDGNMPHVIWNIRSSDDGLDEFCQQSCLEWEGCQSYRLKTTSAYGIAACHIYFSNDYWGNYPSAWTLGASGVVDVWTPIAYSCEGADDYYFKNQCVVDCWHSHDVVYWDGGSVVASTSQTITLEECNTACSSYSYSFWFIGDHRWSCKCSNAAIPADRDPQPRSACGADWCACDLDAFVTPQPTLENLVEFVTEIRAPDEKESDKFGKGVSVYENVMVIGAYGDDDQGPQQAGSVYVFEFVNSQWEFQTEIHAPDAAASDYFGWSVSVYENVMAVGARSEDGSGISDSGSVYIYEFVNSQWEFQTKIFAPDATASDYFGGSVSIYNDVLAIGAHLDDGAIGNGGSVYLYQQVNSQWEFQAELHAPDAARNDRFGISVSVYENVMAVGAYLDDSSGVDDGGSVYLYELVNSQWEFQEEIHAPDAATGDWFGQSVSVYENIMTVGAYKDDGAASNGGSVYLYQRVNSQWEFQEEIHAPDAENGDYFSSGVSVYENVMAFGAQGNHGSVYIYTHNIVSTTCAPEESTVTALAVTTDGSGQDADGRFFLEINFPKYLQDVTLTFVNSDGATQSNYESVGSTGGWALEDTEFCMQRLTQSFTFSEIDAVASVTTQGFEMSFSVLLKAEETYVDAAESVEVTRPVGTTLTFQVALNERVSLEHQFDTTLRGPYLLRASYSAVLTDESLFTDPSFAQQCTDSIVAAGFANTICETVRRVESGNGRRLNTNTDFEVVFSGPQDEIVQLDEWLVSNEANHLDNYAETTPAATETIIYADAVTVQDNSIAVTERGEEHPETNKIDIRFITTARNPWSLNPEGVTFSYDSESAILESLTTVELVSGVCSGVEDCLQQWKVTAYANTPSVCDVGTSSFTLYFPFVYNEETFSTSIPIRFTMAPDEAQCEIIQDMGSVPVVGVLEIYNDQFDQWASEEELQWVKFYLNSEKRARVTLTNEVPITSVTLTDITVTQDGTEQCTSCQNLEEFAYQCLTCDAGSDTTHSGANTFEWQWTLDSRVFTGKTVGGISTTLTAEFTVTYQEGTTRRLLQKVYSLDTTSSHSINFDIKDWDCKGEAGVGVLGAVKTGTCNNGRYWVKECVENTAKELDFTFTKGIWVDRGERCDEDIAVVAYDHSNDSGTSDFLVEFLILAAIVIFAVIVLHICHSCTASPKRLPESVHTFTPGELYSSMKLGSDQRVVEIQAKSGHDSFISLPGY